MSNRDMAQLMYESGNIKMAEVYVFIAKVEKSKGIGAF